MRDAGLSREAQRAWDAREPRRGPAFWALVSVLGWVLVFWACWWVFLR